ncbi:alanine/glycine:cation symporter family protein [Cellulosilyticum sp. I15G10I2]|uniref:alanine/glycine:cation symporter family protein n=1 Tax=Cellulosilyticum sp. I15G10I2 TaxID=1892843 RepID=UPI00085CD13E|nr:sodium:alanine symporter family protein [Cellulosilyticum sp. I15G10I2]
MEKFIELVEKINGAVNNVVWGWPMLILIIGTGIYFTIRTNFFQIRRFGHVLNETFFAIFKNKNVTTTKDKKSITQFQALSTALAATIGTGNIVGVATALTAGGEGAIFWMWVSAIFGMMTNYAENVLGIFYRYKNAKDEWMGGPMVYIEKGLGQKWLAVIFSVFCVGASFGIGNMTQVNSISSSLNATYNIPTIITGLFIAAMVALVIVGGIRRIGKVTEKIVPFMAMAYIIGSLIILILHINLVPAVFNSIFTKAFSLKAVGGGAAGTVMASAIKWGFKRGVFSNEAGLGSSVMVHSASDIKEPVKQGLWGIFEVFFDTIIVCSLTAFVIISTGALNSGAQGSELAIIAFSDGFSTFAGHFVTIAILLFAFSTILGWSYYGERAMEYLLGLKSIIFYKIAFILMIVVGATVSLDLVWDISDTLNALMAIPNLIGVLLLSGVVIRITNNYIGRNLSKIPSEEKPMCSAYDK